VICALCVNSAFSSCKLSISIEEVIKKGVNTCLQVLSYIAIDDVKTALGDPDKYLPEVPRFGSKVTGCRSRYRPRLLCYSTLLQLWQLFPLQTRFASIAIWSAFGRFGGGPKAKCNGSAASNCRRFYHSVNPLTYQNLISGFWSLENLKGMFRLTLKRLQNNRARCFFGLT